MAGVEGRWCASADESGVCVEDLADRFNLPRSITSSQSAAKAYTCAARVWDQVRNVLTYSTARQILEDAGCVLHSYCGMD